MQRQKHKNKSHIRMKSPFSYPRQFSSPGQKRQGAFDGVVSRKSAASPVVSRDTRPMSERRFVAPSRTRVLDGAHREKQAFLKQLHEWSFGDVLWRLLRQGGLYYRRVRRLIIRLAPRIAPRQMLYGSLVGGIAFGMVSMAFMEHFFGPGVFARFEGTVVQTTELAAGGTDVVILGDGTDAKPDDYDSGSDIFFEYFNETAEAQYKENVKKMVRGYPIEAMLPYIFEQDRLTAAFLIGIAKKESNWGKRGPVLDDQDCFNYWGYRGVRRMMGTGGHPCFNSRKDAGDTVAKRLDTLIRSEKLNTPEKMIIWKCGFSCSGHSRESVKKWISDVDMYFKQLSDE